MQPYQQRVVDEQKELVEKLEKLTVFCDTNPIYETLPFDEKVRLILQARIMNQYIEILEERIEAFEDGE